MFILQTKITPRHTGYSLQLVGCGQSVPHGGGWMLEVMVRPCNGTLCSRRKQRETDGWIRSHLPAIRGRDTPERKTQSHWVCGATSGRRPPWLYQERITAGEGNARKGPAGRISLSNYPYILTFFFLPCTQMVIFSLKNTVGKNNSHVYIRSCIFASLPPGTF